MTNKKQKIEVVVLSDTHDRICAVPDGDILIHAGDLTMMGRPNQIMAAAEWLRGLPHPHKIVIAGNHDWLFQTNPRMARSLLGDGITYLENEGCEVMGLKFWGSPVTPTFFDWAFNVDRGAPIRKYWGNIPAGLDMLITHGPPHGILDQSVPHSNYEHCGCDDLLMTVQEKKPHVHVFGHIHGGRGMYANDDTIFYNASIVDEAYKVAHDPWVITFEKEGK